MSAPKIDPVPPADAVRARVPAALAEDDEVVTHADDPDRFDERERAALAWTHAIAWNSDLADAGMWKRLHACFAEPELVELGYAIAFSLGQQHWLGTLGLTDG